MTKPRILINDLDPVSIYSEQTDQHIVPRYLKYFDIVKYHPKIALSDFDLIMTKGRPNQTWYNDLVAAGARLVIDNQWERHVYNYMVTKYREKAFIWSSKNYMWVNEHYWYKNLGYNNYKPNKNCSHLAFMPIRQYKPHRQQLVKALTPFLDQLLYSIIDQGIYLPNDQPPDLPSMQRYIDPSWYNSTYFSIISETITYSKIEWSYSEGLFYNIHLTEKTYKAMAFYHPFMIFGQVGMLAELHNRGFETFENLFDESYDTTEDQATRLNIIINNLANFIPGEYDQLTQEKLKHNHNLFYNSAVVDKIFKEEIIDPLIEYASTT